MTRERHRRVTSLFLDIRGRHPQVQQAALDDACAQDPELRAEVESLLRHDDSGVGLLEAAPLVGAVMPGGGEAGSGPPRIVGSLAEGTPIGRYRVVRFLAGGAMGAVYEAVQEQPRRRVAVKVMHPGAAAPSALRRFELEVQVLGQLKHPGIAQIIEAGRFEHQAREQPYFVMELIDGPGLLEHARARRLGTRERLRLVIRICDAVQHAHQKGVIHRDLKPANILVDASGQPKVLDFGVARATDVDMRLTTMHTDIGQLIGTLPYMSPEQVRARPDELDTRSDVYALGVICYELLTGRLPHDIRNCGVPEAVRVISEQDPRTLSAVDRTLRGDLDTVIAKALDKDKTLRYATVAGLGADLERYLCNEPVVARPPSAVYQMRKFARRHRGMVAALAGVFVSLLGAVVGISFYALDAQRARRAAEVQAFNAGQASEFLARMLASADPVNTSGRKITVREVLDRTAGEIDTGFESVPQTRAYLHATLGRTYLSLGLYDQATQHLEAALETRSALLGAVHEKTLTAAGQLATVHLAAGRLDIAEAQLRETMRNAERILGPDHKTFRDAAANLVVLLIERGELSEAEILQRRTLALDRKRHGADSADTLQSMTNLASILFDQGSLDDAADLLREAAERHDRVFGADDPRALTVTANLGSVLRKCGRDDEAEPLYRDVFERKRRVLGPDHDSVLISMYNLAVLLDSQKKYDPAAELFRELLDAAQRGLPEGHWRIGLFRAAYGMTLEALQRYEEAESEFLASHAILHAAQGADHAQTRAARKRLVNFYDGRGRAEEAARWRSSLKSN